jgi:hypothetical protein
MLELRICVPLGGNADELGFLKARLCLGRPPTWAGQVLTLDRCETKPCEKPMMGQDVWFSMTFLDFDVGGRLNLQLHHATPTIFLYSKSGVFHDSWRIALQVCMPKWARTTRAGASRATLGEASGKDGTRPPVKFAALNIGKGTVQ